HKQLMRDRIMNKFRSRAVEILVATDVASRGIDVKDVEMVVNYDLPKDEEDYVHRIGRTGRAGKNGLALSFASGKDIFRLRNIERVSKQKIPRRPVPTLDQVETAHHSVILEKVRGVLAAGGLNRFGALVDPLIHGEVAAPDVAAALLTMPLPDAPAKADRDTAFDPEGEAGRFDRKPRGDFGGKGGSWAEEKRPRRGDRESKRFEGGAVAKLFL